jgi:hypothetical protein
LAYQLLLENPTLLPLLFDAYNTQRRKLLSSVEYMSARLQELVQCVGETYLIIDGLDECEEKDRCLLLKSLVDICHNCSNLRLAVGSRDEVDISRILKQKSQTIFVNNANEDDIEAFVRRRLDELSQTMQLRTPLHGRKHDVMVFLEPIVRKAEGLFPKRFTAQC